MDYLTDELNNIIENYIYNDLFNDNIVEEELKVLIYNHFENINNIDIFYFNNGCYFRVFVVLNINKMYDPIKFRKNFDIEILINNKRKNIINKCFGIL